MYFLSAIGIAMAGAICFYENNNISINRITINREVNGKIKIVQLSDLHSKEFGKENNKLLNDYKMYNGKVIELIGEYNYVLRTIAYKREMKKLANKNRY